MIIRPLTAAVLAAGVVLGVAGCAQDNSGVAIYSICAPPVPTATGTGGATCTYAATCAASFVGNAQLDTTTAKLDFRLPLQFNNLLPDNSSTTDGRVNTNNATVQWLEITYTGGNSVAGVSVPLSVTIPTLGTAVTEAPLIPAAILAQFAPASAASTMTWIINVRAHGVLGQGSSFTTPWFQVPVETCVGCLAGPWCPASTPVLSSCPSTAPGQTSPGQTANWTCTALQ